MNVSRFSYQSHLENVMKVMNIRRFNHPKRYFHNSLKKIHTKPWKAKCTIVPNFGMIGRIFNSICWPFHEQRTLIISSFITFALTPTNPRELICFDDLLTISQAMQAKVLHKSYEFESYHANPLSIVGSPITFLCRHFLGKRVGSMLCP